MSRKVQLVLLCEDKQHEAFLRRFFEGMGWKKPVRVERAPTGRGSAEQFVRKRFAKELREYRRRHVGTALVVMMDGDAGGTDGRLDELEAECREMGIDPRNGEERVAIFVPTWCIETWLAYLDGETVEENRGNYPRLPRERDCAPHVNALVRMCSDGGLREPAPPSLLLACLEYRTRL